MSYTVGIDEAGRGPLAGPVSVGMVKIKASFDTTFFKGIRDSKKLSAKKREEWFLRAEEARKAGQLDWAVSLVSEKGIDKEGIAPAIRLGMKRCLEKLSIKNNDWVFLDGGLKLPGEFVHQETIIKGDEKIAVISLASICAKVVRDRYMVTVSKKYPAYGFEIHKGYGTKLHIETIKKYGPSEVHRKSFLKNIVKY
jgi:ribonuclease HII